MPLMNSDDLNVRTAASWVLMRIQTKEVVDAIAAIDAQKDVAKQTLISVLADFIQ